MSIMLKHMYNKFDCVVRFLYTQIPIVRNIIRKILFWKIYTSDFNRIDDVFIELDETFNHYGITLRDKQIVELGPGNSIALALNCLCNGAQKYQMVDKYPRIFKNDKQTESILKQIAYFENKYGCNLNDFVNKITLEFNQEKLSYVKNSVEDLKTISSDSIDLILSISVFEHVKDVETSFQKMNRILKMDGVMYHKIDLRDHYNFDEPFKFLKYSDFLWNNFLTKEGFSYTNRLRVDDFKNILAKHGFEIIELENDIFEGDLPNKGQLNERFSNKDNDDLKVIGMTILAKKVNGGC